jgi:hypothetical protein
MPRVRLLVAIVAAVVASYTLLLAVNVPPMVRAFAVISPVAVDAPVNV